MLCRNQDKWTAGQLFSQPFLSQSPGIKLKKQEQFPCVLLFHSAGLQLALWWRQGFIHPLEASLGLPPHQSCVAEERPQSTVVQPDGEGAQDVLWSLSSYTCLNSQSNMHLQQQISQNIYFVHCNLSKEPCIIFTVYAALFAYPEIQVSAAP